MSCADGPLLELPGGQGAWAKLNAGQLAPVRVQYPGRLWKALAAAAQHPDQLPEVPPAALSLLIDCYSELAGLLHTCSVLSCCGRR